MIERNIKFYKDKHKNDKPNKELINKLWRAGASFSDIENILNIEIDCSNSTIAEQNVFIREIVKLDSTTWGKI